MMMHAAAQNLQVLYKNFVKQKIHPIFEVLWEDLLPCEMELFLPKYWVSNKFYLTPFIRYRKGWDKENGLAKYEEER